MRIKYTYIIGSILFSIVLVVLFHFSTYRLLLSSDFSVTPDASSIISDIGNDAIISITGTPNRFFHASSREDSYEVFSLEEYEYKFLIKTNSVKDIYKMTTFRGYAYIVKDNAQYEELVSVMNSPLDVSDLLNFDFDTTEINTITEKTQGAFNEQTIVVDVKLAGDKDNLQLLFTSGIEFLIILSISLLLLKDKIVTETA